MHVMVCYAINAYACYAVRFTCRGRLYIGKVLFMRVITCCVDIELMMHLVNYVVLVAMLHFQHCTYYFIVNEKVSSLEWIML